jgi:hypothetical protein
MDKREHTFVFTEYDVVLLSIALANVDLSKIKETLKEVPESYGDINQELEGWKKDFQRLDSVLNERKKNQSRFIKVELENN